MSAALSLFDPPPVQPLTAEQRRADVEAWLWTLVPIAIELAYANKEHGVTVGDIRVEAAKRGLMTNTESKTRGSYLWRVPVLARLVKTRERRGSKIKAAHNNANVVYVAPEYARAA